MSWTNLAILSLGLGIGIAMGWFGRRLQAGTPSGNATWNNAQTEPNRHTQDSGGHSEAIVPSYPTNSEIQALERQLHQMQLAYQMAREMAQFQSGFLARTSHELRSPINSVISLHQLILADLAEDPAEEREFVAQANQSAQKMLALMDQLISVSKAAHGTAELQLQAVSLWEALAEIEQFTQLQARNRNLRLNIELPEPDILVWADRNWLRQILLNLVDGPIALMQEGHIHLTTQADLDAQQVRISIEDERPARFWYDPIDLLTAIKTNKASAEGFSRDALLEERSQEPSPGLSLLITQTLLDLMGGHLDILSIPSTAANTEDAITRIQCSLPLANS